MIVDPKMHNTHPSHPNRLNFSCKKIEDRIAETTTDRAPMGVTSTASVKEYATRFNTSPKIMMIIPLHHRGDFRYCIPSPAVVSYFFWARSKPFFLSTKLDPMKKPEAMAMPIPTYLKKAGLEGPSLPCAIFDSVASAAEAEERSEERDVMAAEADAVRLMEVAEGVAVVAVIDVRLAVDAAAGSVMAVSIA